MKERGLGTPATRAEIIETLLRRAYAERQGKALAATETGIRLIDLVHPELKSAALTGEWEAQLARIRRKEVTLPDFMGRIEAFVREMVGQTLSSRGAGTRGAPVVPSTEGPAVEAFLSEPKRPDLLEVPGPAPSDDVSAERPRGVTAPADPSGHGTTASLGMTDLATLLHDRFRLPSFRPHQEAVCRAVVEGHDVLLVMPTGAGKSLCYQLPGLARGGTTLVVSPLIALMEDQVAKLKALGLRAERIHSGRDRSASRAVA
jgi:DNA topoisomerase-3